MTVRIFLACSLDGFIAGPNHELDWLEHDGVEDTFTPFLEQIGAMLMGRNTYDVASSFDVPWPYGDTPVLVATTRPLSPKVPSVEPVDGTIEELVALARERAGERGVYLDGGALSRAALDARLVDTITLTVVPVILGAGIPLFAGCTRRHRLRLDGERAIGGGMVELRYTVA